MHGTWTTTGGHVARGLTRQPVLALGGIGAAVIAWHVDPIGVLVAVAEVGAVAVGVPLTVLGIRRSIERRRQVRRAALPVRIQVRTLAAMDARCDVCGKPAAIAVQRASDDARLALCDVHKTPALARIAELEGKTS